MAEKEPRDPEASSSSEPPLEQPADATLIRRQQFNSWVQSLQHKARVARSSQPPPRSSAPPANPQPTPLPLESEHPPLFHHIPKDVLREARENFLASVPAAEAPTTPPPPPAAVPANPHFIPSFSEDLPADEHTVVFSPPPELLVRSGAQPAVDSAWEEPTQVVNVSNVLRALAAAKASQPPSAGPPLERLGLEPKVQAFVTPAPPPARRTRWLLWAFAAVLAGAVTAAFAEYSLHPPPPRAPASGDRSR
jgi:hypothetical protein